MIYILSWKLTNTHALLRGDLEWSVINDHNKKGFRLQEDEKKNLTEVIVKKKKPAKSENIKRLYVTF